MNCPHCDTSNIEVIWSEDDYAEYWCEDCQEYFVRDNTVERNFDEEQR